VPDRGRPPQDGARQRSTDKEVTTAQAKAEEHLKMQNAYRNLAGKGQFAMEGHCQQLVQHYESVAAANAALAEAHRQMARVPAQQKQ
jgi:hypothetical protein